MGSSQSNIYEDVLILMQISETLDEPYEIEEFVDELCRSFRLSAKVTSVLKMRNGEIYPICPRCHNTIDREYQHFCDRCGQLLDWGLYENATIILHI